ncbi:related to Y.lipolytica GPR1 protein and Fun34p [Rhynchosporium agropyri]|uniref:Related to Y.lipolytica GPR1 protein and Fun34p n=1 Tax=Rhynchosporium agropyri TaxID=914238 RepID=A0A1E1LTY9_9HELO|nr:related to Y.lipolytica GPR1 protein and Fun34p [Rhynchosporium agropyri]
MATSTHNGQAPLEKDFSNNGYANGNGSNSNSYHLNDTNMDNDTALRRIRTAGSISISPELFEKIYLSPQNAVKGDLRKTFGNPTPLALVGFLLCLSPLSCILMGWRGAGGNGASGIGSYFFFGGLLMLVGGFLEFILGNTFPFVVFMSFGAFWLTFAATLQPFYAAFGSYAPAGEPEAAGIATVGFTASFAFFLVFMGLLCFIYLICALRTNVVFVIIFATLVPSFGLLAGAYWHNALALSTGSASHAETAHKCQVAAGAFTFVTSMAGWWIFFAIMLAALDFPFQLPVGDLSTLIKGASEKVKTQESMV